MNRYELFLLVLAVVLLAVGTWLLAGERTAAVPALLGLTTTLIGFARYRHRQLKRH
jgi:hypothetical protein